MPKAARGDDGPTVPDFIPKAAKQSFAATVCCGGPCGGAPIRLYKTTVNGVEGYKRHHRAGQERCQRCPFNHVTYKPPKCRTGKAGTHVKKNPSSVPAHQRLYTGRHKQIELGKKYAMATIIAFKEKYHCAAPNCHHQIEHRRCTSASWATHGYFPEANKLMCQIDAESVGKTSTVSNYYLWY